MFLKSRTVSFLEGHGMVQAQETEFWYPVPLGQSRKDTYKGVTVAVWPVSQESISGVLTLLPMVANVCICFCFVPQHLCAAGAMTTCVFAQEDSEARRG